MNYVIVDQTRVSLTYSDWLWIKDVLSHIFKQSQPAPKENHEILGNYYDDVHDFARIRARLHHKVDVEGPNKYSTQLVEIRKSKTIINEFALPSSSPPNLKDFRSELKHCQPQRHVMPQFEN